MIALKKRIALILCMLITISAVQGFAMESDVKNISENIVMSDYYTDNPLFNTETISCSLPVRDICKRYLPEDIRTILVNILNTYRYNELLCDNWSDILSDSVSDGININVNIDNMLDTDSTNAVIAEIIANNNTDDFNTPNNFVSEYNTNNINDNIRAEQILAIVNKERAEYGLDCLSLDAQLTNMAQYKAEDMAAYGFLHDGSYGQLQNLLDKFNISYSCAGENIAMNQTKCEEVMEDWMNSDGHRANILNSSYTKLGVGYYEDNGNTYWVQEFIG